MLDSKLKILKTDEKATFLANKYLAAKLIPKKYRTDAFHIAITTVNLLDAIASWNLSHIVRKKTITGVNIINKTQGYNQILIITPKEVIL